MSVFKKESKKGIQYIKDKYGVDVPALDKIDTVGECLFCIYDKVCEEYNPPFVSKNMNTALRSIKETLKGNNSVISIHPEDYVLVQIGTFSKDTGFIYPVDLSCSEFYPLSRLFVSSSDENLKVGDINEISK